METTESLARGFVWDFFRTGLALTDLAESLIEMLPEDAYPGEEPGEVVLDMMTASIRPAVDAAGPKTVRDVRALISAAYDRVIADLEKTIELRRERDARSDE
jgi:hypothetical protein